MSTPRPASATRLDVASRLPSLAELTTLRVGGPVSSYVAAASEQELCHTVSEADAADTALLVLGGGSNLLAADDGFAGLVVRDARRGIDVAEQQPDQVRLRIPAGQDWDDVVATAVAEGWSGIEALSGIPGSAGATPVQNVGAYGQEISETLASVRIWDRATGQRRTMAITDLALGYRDSILKRSLHNDEQGRSWAPTPRYVVSEIELLLRRDELSAPIRYAELARRLGIDVGQRAPAGEVRAAVLELRRGKGMVLDAGDYDTHSAGSFFTNPVLSEQAAAQLPEDAPRYPVLDYGRQTSGAEAATVPGKVKTSAAWLISAAGFDKGYGLPGPAALSTKHTLALTNRGRAHASDLVAIARDVRDGVAERFGISLQPEPVLLGLHL